MKSSYSLSNLITIAFLTIVGTGVVQAQLPPICNPSYSGKLICVLPQVYGPTGLTLPNTSHEAHFVNSLISSFVPVTAAVGTELSLQSVAYPASAVLFTFSPTSGAVTRSTESFGPITAERAETVGRHRFYVAGTYQYFNFSTLDGLNLHKLPVEFLHASFPVPGLNANDYIPGTSMPIYEEEYVSTLDNIDLKINQVTLYATYGVTSRIDVSVAVPIVNVHFGATSSAMINRETALPEPIPTTDPLYGSTDNTGFFHYFSSADPAGSVSQVFSSKKSATGIGDMVLRVKGTAVTLEHLRAALGLDLRIPTGDAANFHGSGAIGIKPFLAASYAGRISPHANLGFEYNGSSVLASNSVIKGNVPGTGTTFVGTGKLPNQFFYAFGVDASLNHRVTFAIDFLGQHLSSTFRIRQTNFVDITGMSHPDIQDIVGYKGSENLENLSVGAKVNLVGNLLLTANGTFKLNDAGLRATVVPLIGLSYSF